MSVLPIIPLQQYQDIWYGYEPETNLWLISNQEKPIGAIISWYSGTDFRIDEAIEHYREDLIKHQRQRSCPVDYD